MEGYVIVSIAHLNEIFDKNQKTLMKENNKREGNSNEDWPL
jgi:hypothetical protein